MKVRGFLSLVLISGGIGYAQPARDQVPASRPASEALTPTSHPLVPDDPTEIWMVPAESRKRPQSAHIAGFVTGTKLHASGRYAEALPLFQARSLAETALAGYAAYYAALTEFRLSRLDEARSAFAALSGSQPLGYLSEGAALREAEVAETQGDYGAAIKIYEQLARRKPLAPDEVWLRLGRAAQAAGAPERAKEAYQRVYYEFAMSDLATLAGTELERLALEPLSGSSVRYKLELGRAQRLFGSRRYAEARSAFELVRPHAAGDDRELIALRLAECDFYLRRYRSARDGIQPYIDRASRRAEAQFFYLTATRELGDRDEYVQLARQLVSTFPDSSWAEETLNNLATHYVVINEDAQADTTFRELLTRFPSGRYAERAAWKSGWWAYKNGRHDEAARVFEEAAAAFPRSDYRPSYLYWAARSRDRLGDRQSADTTLEIVTADYLNSYYGRLASKLLNDRGGRRAARTGLSTGDARRVSANGGPDDVRETGESSDSGTLATEPPSPPTEELIRLLLSLELYDEALNELQHAQRVWGDSPALQATLAWTYSRKGDLRRGINTMKRAYPQYLAAGGEKLPPEVLKVLFPVSYWPLIRQHATSRNLDPYLIAALIAQESTFIPDIRSSANAIGLMQVVPSTGRRYARTLRIRRFSTGMLQIPETNLRLGTAYFADLLKQFGGVHLALASYNAGEHRIVRWIAERPGLERDEFIDDIPFPETQNYVRKILGTAEDYRRLYGPAGAGAFSKSPAKKPPAKPPARRSVKRKRS